MPAQSATSASSAPTSSSSSSSSPVTKTPPKTPPRSGTGASSRAKAGAASSTSVAVTTPDSSAETRREPRARSNALSSSPKGKEKETAVLVTAPVRTSSKRLHDATGSASSPSNKNARTDKRAKSRSPQRSPRGGGPAPSAGCQAGSQDRPPNAVGALGQANLAPVDLQGAGAQLPTPQSVGLQEEEAEMKNILDSMPRWVNQDGDLSGDLSNTSSSSASSSGLGISREDRSFGDNRDGPLQTSSTVSRGAYHQCGTARRVKVYELQGDSWQDRGTGFCAGVYDEGRDEALLAARVEDACEDLPLEKSSSPEPMSGGPSSGQAGATATENPASPQKAGQEGESQNFMVVITPTLEADDLLLLTTVVRDDVYQRQQDTLIVWTEPHGQDMALSFQEADGCQEIWDFLQEVQKHFNLNAGSVDGPGGVEGGVRMGDEGFESPPLTPNPDSSPSALGTAGHDPFGPNGAAFVLPDPSLGNLALIEMSIKDAAARSPHAREKIAAWMLRSNFLHKLLPIFSDAEDLEQLEALHRLCSITQTTLMLNEHSLLEQILQDDVFLGVVGMLEYDPEFPTLKASYRDFLQNTTKFRTVVDIEDPVILAKIHQTYRLQYLRDVILARVLDDAMFSVLNSFIFFHQVDIVGFCSANASFLNRFFSVYGEVTIPRRADAPGAAQHMVIGNAANGQNAGLPPPQGAPSLPDRVIAYQKPPSGPGTQQMAEGVIFLQQLCAMGKQVQLPARIGLYRSLVDWGLLSVLEWALQLKGEMKLRNAAAEVLLTIIEYDVSSVRAHALAQAEASTKPISTLLVESLHAEQDLGLKAQMSEATRVLLDTSAEMGAANPVAQTLAAAAAAAVGSRPKDESDRFLNLVYEGDIERLFSPFFSLPLFKVIAPGASIDLSPRARSALFAHLCDLLCYVIVHHTFRSQYFIITSDIVRHVVSLLYAREKHIRLAALRFLKACLTRNNQYINRHFVKVELVGAVLAAVEHEKHRDNLVASACLDFFAYLRRENVKPLIAQLVDSFGDRLRALATAPLVGGAFQALLDQHERNLFPAPEIGDMSASDAAASLAAEKERRQRDLARRGANRATMDSDEESYFNDDSDDENVASQGQQPVVPSHDTGGGFILEPPGAEVAKKLAIAEAPVSLAPKAEPTLKRRKSPIQKMSEVKEEQPRQKRRRSGADAVSLSGPSTGQFDDADEDEDIIGRLAKRQALKNKDKDEDEEGGFLRDKSATPVPSANAGTASPSATLSSDEKQSGSATNSSAPGLKKISLGLSSSSKRMAAATSAGGGAANNDEQKPK
ncbi:Protein predicted to be involved in carbohydrate metabolism [Ceraceosorus bombacis]|uniref:Protein predicted to be involved in carbohydrate metabolism n=1 Tax=Ceraceosorus bombacis TaxID=401625 RepID=A0A0P1BG14_9BASI|nr:Protein predicted to be involved in carbohydrate metabolism [Ceraceosorus bombacis]